MLPGLYIDAQHVSGDPDRSERGWFDVIALADGRAALMVGEDIGVGEPASGATVSSDLVRTVLARMLSEGDDLEAVLEGLHTSPSGGAAADGRTLSVAVLDPQSGIVDYCTRDQAPPLVVTADGRARALRRTGGTDEAGTSSAGIERVRLSLDDVLVLHTGVVSPDMSATSSGPATSSSEDVEEQPRSGHRNPTARTEQICRAAAAGIRDGGTSEDLAVVAVQIKPLTPRLTVAVPAVVESLAPAAQAVTDWLAGLRSSVEDGAGMAVAMAEAVTNAVQHAFVGTRPGSVQVECRLLADGMLVCSVSDDGRWLPADSSKPGRNGRGLRVMARACDRLRISRESSGTVVELRRRLHHPVLQSTS